MTRLAVYVGLADRAERALAESFQQVALGHAAEGEIAQTCLLLATWSVEHVERLAPVRERYGEQPDDEPERLHAEALPTARSGPLGLVRDLQDLYVLCGLVLSTWTVLGQAAMGARDDELQQVAAACGTRTGRQQAWCLTHLKTAAPQALIGS